jgi:excisionase family DNA binding protein
MRDKGITVFTEDLVSVQEAARRLSRPRSTLYRWIDAGTIVTIRLGGILFVPTSEIERLAGLKPNGD